MSRFAGFQSDNGVAVLDTMTGELVFYPFDGGSPTVLRRPTAAAVEAPRSDASSEASKLGATLSWSRDHPAPDDRHMLRSERRLKSPRPLIIRDLDSDEIAAVKAARMTKGARLLSELVLKPARPDGPARPDSVPEDET